MRNDWWVRAVLAVLVAVLLTSCGWFPVRVGPDEYDGTESVFFHDLDDVNPKRGVHYKIDIGTEPKDMYLVLTNPTYATIDSPIVEVRSVVDGEPVTSVAPSARVIDARGLSDKPPAIRDNPEVTAWERPSLATGPASRSLAPPPPPPSYAVVPGPDGYGVTYSEYTPLNTTTYEFYVDSDMTTVDAVLATRVEAHGKALEIWVQDSEYVYQSMASYPNISEDMAIALAATFLEAGTDDDIYEWVTSVFGDEWSAEAAAYSNLIDSHDTITILLYPILIFPDDSGPGGVVGYFWGKDNFLRGSDPIFNVSYSNERIMFYIDSESFAYKYPEEGTWDIDDYWPTEIVSTLAHEFQHMIHFHERGILKDANTPTWLNELMSMAAEDLIEEKRMRQGPRGVDPAAFTDGSAGSANNKEGRIPLYNLANDISLTGWDSSGDVLESYAISYSFGAYLARSYDGAELFENMMASSSSSAEAVISSAIQASTGEADVDLETLLPRWGAAVLLSDGSHSSPYRLNPGSWMTSATGGGAQYSLGSINHYNYEVYTGSGPELLDGPYIHADGSLPSTMRPTSKFLYRVGTGLAGTVDLDLEFTEGMDFAVVLK